MLTAKFCCGFIFNLTGSLKICLPCGMTTCFFPSKVNVRTESGFTAAPRACMAT